MAKGWLSGAIFISIASLIAHSAPAKATRPLVHASGAMSALRLSQPRDLGDVLSGKAIGLQLDDNFTRIRVLAQAKRFHTYRLGGKSAQEDFQKSCAAETERDNIFCQVESEIRAEKATAAAMALAKARAGAESAAQVAAHLREGDLERLATYSSAELAKGASQFSGFETLAAVGQRVIALSGCSHAVLAGALAARAEESFPEDSVLDLARQLYERAAQCGVEPAASHARFRQGLIAIWTKKNDQATTAMRAVVSAPAGSPYHGRAKFWLHHLARLAKNEGQAVEMRESLWRDHTMSFHNLVVNGREPRLQALISNATAPKVVMRSLLRPDVNAHVRSIEALLETGARELAAEFADRLAAKSGNAEPEVRLYLAALMHRAGSALPKFRILTSLFQDAPRLVSRPTLELLFPKWYFDIVRTKAKDIDPLLVLSLIRQESAFNERAHSTAGARGLMQVMPATARSIAAVRKNRLWDPNTNVEVGTKYLAHRLERYNGDVELTLAAYNAGFSRVDRWMKRYPLENKLLFVDLIPFRETREYVSSILRNYFWYTQLYGDEGAEMAAAGGTTASEPGEGSGAAFSKTSRNQEKVSRILEANAGARAPANDLIAR